MKKPLIPRSFHSIAPNERGVTMLLVAVAMVAIIGMAALSIDLVALYLAREEAQRAADTAALSAARIISESGITGTASISPANTNYWKLICGAASGSTQAGLATQVAQVVVQQNGVGGSIVPLTSITINYSAGGSAVSGSSSDCSTLSSAFAVNPLVTVQVTRTGLATFFARVWGLTGSTISATATAEVLNPSASDANSGNGVIPVQPKCVKPWIVPNSDPGKPGQFVSTADGSIINPGLIVGAPPGVVGEVFNLYADCASSNAPCTPKNNPPLVNQSGGIAPNTPNLEYFPGSMQSANPVAVPSCQGSGSPYEDAVAGCDQGTLYECGTQQANTIDLSESPGGSNGDTANGVACTIDESLPFSSTNSGQDTMETTTYPFVMKAGTANPNTQLRGSIVTSSNSIMSLPIYTGGAIGSTGTTNITIVGFLQVFVNYVNGDGSLNVTVLNVAGCGDAATNPAVLGSSPVPIRLITPP